MLTHTLLHTHTYTRTLGTVLKHIDISKRTAYLLGRTPTSDITLEHPLCSRRHAALLFHENGAVMLYDMASSHGSFLNKRRVEPQTYVELRVGDMLRFGQSQRMYILTGACMACVVYTGGRTMHGSA